MRKMGLGKMGNLPQIVPFFSPISNQFYTFFLHFREGIFAFSHNSVLPPIFPHFAAIFPFSPFFRAPAASRLIRLRLARTLASPPHLPTPLHLCRSNGPSRSSSCCCWGCSSWSRWGPGG